MEMSVEAFILVGGRSSRLGRDKALERVGDKTLAERALRVVQEALPEVKISFVAGSELGFAVEATRLDTPFVFDLIEGRGPLGGLHAALMHATADWVFILACDLPFVSSDVIARLAEHTNDPSTEFTVILPEQPDGRLQPLCGFYNVAASKLLVDEIIHRPRPSPPMHEIIQQLRPKIVKPEEYASEAGTADQYFANVNTEEDLTLARIIDRRVNRE